MKANLLRDYGRALFSRASKDWRIQFFQHVLTGGIATAAHYVIMWIALVLSSIPVLATTFGFVAGATTRFLFSYFHVFDPEQGAVKAMPRFVLALALQMLVNAGLLSLLLYAAYPVWPSQVSTTGVLVILNFVAHQFEIGQRQR